MNVDGLVTRISDFDPGQTMDRLAAAAVKQGMSVLARIDHAAAAANIGMSLRPTEVLIFGNPRSGTPLMERARTIGIDLPLKALVWQDDHEQTWLAYTEPRYQAVRHGITPDPGMILDRMEQALMSITHDATTREAGDQP